MNLNKDFFELIRPVRSTDLVRVGRNYDGGYVINKTALKDAGLISFGINDDWSFENDFGNYSKGEVLMYDGSVSLTKFKQAYHFAIADIFSLKFIYSVVRKPATFAAQLAYIKKLKALYKDFKKLLSKDKRKFHSLFLSNFNDALHVTPADVFSNADKNSGYFLKIDIEGDEYRILDMLQPYQQRITGIAVEFHDLDIMMERFTKQVAVLKENFYITHVHANNYSPVAPGFGLPAVWEISFINKKLMEGDPLPVSNQSYPLQGFDFANEPGKADFGFNF